MKQHESLLRCPICQKGIKVTDDNVVCEQNHAFDIAKKGYINFMTKPVNTKYDKELFEARHHIIASGMYEPLHKKIRTLIDEKYETANIIDLGCGEGTHLAYIVNEVEAEVTKSGMDIAKEGVMTAAKNHLDMLWCVGDLAQSPFQSSTFDVALNILSPANYDEFKRLLTDDGMVIKVVPRAGYLKELREAFYDQEDYTNEQTVDRFKENMNQVETYHLSYTFSLSKDLVPSLHKMTPLTWNVARDVALDLSEVSIDLDILIGKTS